VRSHLFAALLLVALACDDAGESSETSASPDADITETEVTQPTGCQIEGAEPPDSVAAIGCVADFEALASEPLDTSIPGARSVKVVLDREDNDALYFQNSQKYPIHHDFAAAQLSGNGLPIVPALATFNQSQYQAPDRRFLLGALTHYEGPDLWVLEVAPYDTASAAMIDQLFSAVRDHFYGTLGFHPTSELVASEVAATSIPIVTTDDIYAGITYQPLNLAVAYGRLNRITAAALAATYVSYRDIVVLDAVPNDITVVSGIITQEFQTPLSHINVLSQNRKTPNMGLLGALDDAALAALDGKWVRLEVGALDWSIAEVTQAEADTWWEGHRPTPVVLPDPDLTITDLRDIDAVTPEPATPAGLRDALATSVKAFGGKAAHYSVLARTADVPVRKAFAIPAYYYVQFMQDNGFVARIEALLDDPNFVADPAVRDAALASLRDDMGDAPVDDTFEALLRDKLDTDYPGLSMRFRSSTNSEDLDGFPCAGCYESHTGDAGDWEDVLDAIRDTWASAWLFRTFEERAYNGVDHLSVVMPLLVHHNFPDEEANGVALTSNPYDATGNQPGFYINVQFGGDVEVVHPPAGTSSDQIIYLFDQPGSPIIYLSHSNIIADGTTVLTTAQLHELGVALDAIHDRFAPAYGPASGNTGWYAMDVEFKFDGEPGEVPALIVKQARPNPGRGQ
jgi:pyruvate,water dikinase